MMSANEGWPVKLKRLKLQCVVWKGSKMCSLVLREVLWAGTN